MTDMNNQQVYIIVCLIFTLIHLALASNCDKNSNEDIPFTTKIQESPIIVIGTSLKKTNDTFIRNLFNVTFLVSCILKGRPTQRIIHIVQAGVLLGRRSCQQLNINQQYIVFLQPFFDDTYRPTDFEEIPYSSQIGTLLEKTCGLSRTYPFTDVNQRGSMLTNRCPTKLSVYCPSEKLSTTVTSPLITVTRTMATTETTTATTTATIATTIITTKPTDDTFKGKDPLDLAILSLLLYDDQHQNISFNTFQEHHHKSLFSDVEARQNEANQFASTIIINLIMFTLLNVFYVFF